MSQCIRRLFSKTRSRRAFHVEFATTNGPIRRALHHQYTPMLVTPVNTPGHTPNVPRAQQPLRIQDQEAQEELLETITFLLRHNAGKDYGLPSRPDGYLSVKKLLNYPMFHNLDIFKLQRLVNKDRGFRFEIKFDTGKTDGPWWICAKSWQEDYYVLRPALLSNSNGIGIYTTTFDEWEAYISRTGIARLDADYIRLLPYIPNKNYLESFDDESQVFIYIDIEYCILSGLRFYYRVRTSQPRDPATTPILTKGDKFGIISPKFFTRVKLVGVKKTHIWGVGGPLPTKPSAKDPTVYDQHGHRKTFLTPLRRNLHSFVDFYDANDLENRPVHPETIKEAMEVVSVT